MSEISSSSFAGVRFDHFQLDQLVEYLHSSDGTFKMLVTPNVDHVVRCNKFLEFNNIYSKADISVNDSRVLHRLCGLIGINLGFVVPGSDLTRALLETMPDKNVSITVIGGTPKTVSLVSDMYSLRNVHHYNPPMGFINDSGEVLKCIDFIKKHPSTFIFLSIGSPRQEYIARKAKEAGAVGIALCIGASWLFLSGEEKRAPLIVQKLSLEWLFRLLQSPRRLAKRYLVDGLNIIPILFNEKMKK